MLYSMKAAKTNTRHVAIQTSLAFVNDPAGELLAKVEL